MKNISTIRYISTNRYNLDKGKSKTVSFRKALFQGIAPDGGLYMPTSIPTLTKKERFALEGQSYPYIAFEILRKFLGNEIPNNNLETICADIYNYPVPIEKIDKNTQIAFLDRGPSASFKDFAARFMAKVMEFFKNTKNTTTILVATSGDTGSAIGEAFKGIKGFQVFILYPDQEVSPVQRLQLERIGDNIKTISIDGKFDDCQKLVKKAFLDPDLYEMNLTSCNSINIGRIIPQIVYYFYIASNIISKNEPIVFSIPSGNFGNSLGCEFARRMGLPLDQIIIAVNENDEFPNFLSSGNFSPIVPSRKCVSNAMNVGNPSNLARYFDLYGGHLLSNGIVNKKPDLMKMRKNLWSTSVSDSETITIIKETWSNNGIILDPHGAVGLAALRKFQNNNNNRAVVLGTAHPGKFPEIVEESIGSEIIIPKTLKRAMDREKNIYKLDSNYENFKLFLLQEK